MIDKNIIKDKSVVKAIETLLENHTEEEVSKIILNSLSILGAKKIVVQDFLDENSYKSINKYKYPKRLALFLETTNLKSKEWKDLSFIKIALK